MKTDDLYLTTEELDKLCRLYMECRLSVLEEKELEYILSTSSLTSPSIDEVRALMNVQLFPRTKKVIHKKYFWNWKRVAGVAASISVILSVGLFFTAPRTSSLQESDSNIYIAAYSNGTRLSGNEAVEATTLAMAKADSLMKYASLAEREELLKADVIIRETLNN